MIISTYHLLVWFIKWHLCTGTGLASEKHKWESLLQLCTKYLPILIGKHKGLEQLFVPGTALNHRHDGIIESKSTE